MSETLKDCLLCLYLVGIIRIGSGGLMIRSERSKKASKLNNLSAKELWKFFLKVFRYGPFIKKAINKLK